MTWLSLGSLALPYQLQRQGVALRSEITRLGVELTTGQTANPQQHLRGDLGPLAAIESRLARIDSYTQNTRLVAARVDAMQTTLGNLGDLRSKAADSLLATAASGAKAETLALAGRGAHATLQDTVAALGLRVSGQAAFSGIATDSPPLPDADDIITAVLPSVSGLKSATEIHAAVRAALEDPGGVFDTTLYRGDAAGQGASLGDGLTPITHPTAADPAIRELLSGLITAALIAEPTLAINDTQRLQLAQLSAESLLSNATSLTGLQARVGQSQATLDARLLQYSTERDALGSSRNTLLGVDPYEAATRLEEARTQLETLYTVTARTARLSLMEYLR